MRAGTGEELEATGMKVGELISELASLPQDQEIFVFSQDQQECVKVTGVEMGREFPVIQYETW